MSALKAEGGALNPVVYDLVLWLFTIIVDIFFREIHPRGSWRIPRTGPVLFVGAPHANQFLDPLILMRTIRAEAKRRVSFLIAEKSMKRRFIGTMAGSFGAVSVGRAMDTQYPMKGRVYLDDKDEDGLTLRGRGTNFEDDKVQLGGLVVLPSVNNVNATAEIVEVKGPEEIKLKKPFKGAIAMQQLTGRKSEEKEVQDEDTQKQITAARNEDGTTFKIAPKIDQSQVYDQVFDRLTSGGCIGIYPEGGSHDRTELLPLKAGVAIMALGALAQNPDCGLKIVPCGMNYFHAHKFRSRAVVEFGAPVEVPMELVEEFKNGNRREAIGKMLDIIYNALVAVTVTSPDYDTLMMIQAVRRLYNPKGKRLPLPMIVELNRRLVKAYTKYRQDERIIHLKQRVTDYNRRLRALNIRDHQVQYAKLSIPKVVSLFFYRLGKMILLAIATLPGLMLFTPVFAIGKYISIQKAKEALAASSVKIQARDVIATWKVLVALALAPALYAYYIIILVTWTWYNHIQGIIPLSVRPWQIGALACIIFPMMTFAALRFGEIGMDIFKSLRPLLLALNPHEANSFNQLRKQRQELVRDVTNLINELGPEMFPDFDANRIVSGNATPTTPLSPIRDRSWSDVFHVNTRDDSPGGGDYFNKASIGGGSSMSGYLPRNESFRNLGSFGFFASRPTTPHSATPHSTSSRSRRPSGTSGTGGAGAAFGGLKGMTSLESDGALDGVSQKIRGAMKERGQVRERGRRGSVDTDGYYHVDRDEDGGGNNTEDGVTMKKVN